MFCFKRAVIKTYRRGILRVLTFPRVASTVHRVLAFSAANQIVLSHKTFPNPNPSLSERDGQNRF